jgi:hypothetical protein
MRLVRALRRGAGVLPAEAALDELRAGAARRVAARRVAAGFVDGLRFAVLAAFRVRVAVRRVAVAGRRVVDAALPRAICRACFVKPSMRLRTAFTSARVLARLT